MAGKRDRLRHAALGEQHVAVFGRVGEEGDGQQIGLRAGLFGQAVDHVERVGAHLARHAAEQGDKAEIGAGKPRQMIDGGGQRAAVAHADDAVFARFQHVEEDGRGGEAERAERQAGGGQGGDDAAEIEPELAREVAFQGKAVGDRAFDEDAHRADAPRPRDQPVRLERAHPEGRGDLGLGHPAGIVEPGGARGERVLGRGVETVEGGILHGRSSAAAGSEKIFVV